MSSQANDMGTVYVCVYDLRIEYQSMMRSPGCPFQNIHENSDQSCVLKGVVCKWMIKETDLVSCRAI